MARLPSYWLISCVVLISMILQLVLAFGGSLRHRSSTLILQLSLWLSYISADAVAVYGLGTMARESTLNRMFGVWAPLLLLHLGGPDTITAYSTVDNELWKRHLLNMVYQVSVAVYVIYLSELETYLFGAAILLLFAGGLKYGERTVSLRRASFSQIVNSLQPLYIHTSLHELLPCDYVVMGVKRWADQQQTTRKPVTIEQVWISEGRQATDNYILCLAHSLFKMNMRRYVNLYIFEANRIENREFFINENLCHLPTSHEIFQVIEIELKFMYDALFSKSRGTAFSKWGVIMRIVNIFLLVVGGGLVYRALAKGPEKDEVDGTERKVAFVVISVALMAELLQLCRIIASDWTLVWFICMRVEHSGTKFYAIPVWLLGKLRRLRGRHYWMKSIQQYSVKDTCSDISSVVWKVANFLSMTDFITAWYIKSNPIEDEFKQFIFDQIKSKISLGNSRATSTQQILSYDTNVGEDLRWACKTDHEHLIIYWHIATTLCEMEFNRIRYNPPQLGLVDNDSQQGHDIASRFDQSVTDCEDHMEDDNRDDEVTEYKEHMEIEVERNVQLSRTLSNRDDEVTLSEEHMEIDNPYAKVERNVQSVTETELEDHKEDDIRDDEVNEDEDHNEMTEHEDNNEDENRNDEVTDREDHKEDDNSDDEEHIDIDNPYDEIERNVRLSMMLSNYCAYLLVSCPQFLPLNPEIARIHSVGVHSELVRYLSTSDIQNLKDLRGSTSLLGHAARLARELLNKGQAERWKILSDFWAAVLINYASLNRAAVHADHLTVGGEFLTQLWALVGHMGCGNQYQ